MSSIGRGANASRDCDAFDLFFSFSFALVVVLMKTMSSFYELFSCQSELF